MGKKFALIPVFLMVCGFSFAHDIKVIGVIPSPNTGKTYQLQIGAFGRASNANKAAETLIQNGLVPQYEKVTDPKHGVLTRVFVAAAAKDVRSVIDRLGRAGFREVIIREYYCKTAVEPETKPPKPETRPPEAKDNGSQKLPEVIEEKQRREKPILDFVKDPLRHLFPFPASQSGLNTRTLKPAVIKDGK